MREIWLAYFNYTNEMQKTIQALANVSPEVIAHFDQVPNPDLPALQKEREAKLKEGKEAPEIPRSVQDRVNKFSAKIKEECDLVKRAVSSLVGNTSQLSTDGEAALKKRAVLPINAYTAVKGEIPATPAQKLKHEKEQADLKKLEARLAAK